MRLVTADPRQPSEADREWARRQFMGWADADKESEWEVSAPTPPRSMSATPAGAPDASTRSGPQLLTTETDQVSDQCGGVIAAREV
jgi:hypothetical protein